MSMPDPIAMSLAATIARDGSLSSWRSLPPTDAQLRALDRHMASLGPGWHARYLRSEVPTTRGAASDKIARIRGRR